MFAIINIDMAGLTSWIVRQKKKMSLYRTRELEKHIISKQFPSLIIKCFKKEIELFCLSY